MPPRVPFRRDLPVSRDEHRINDRIRVPRVKVVDENGVMLGEMATEQARQIALQRGYDLVEVAAEARPPVCKLLDYGKFKYEEKRRKKKSAKKQHVQQVKEIRLRPGVKMLVNVGSVGQPRDDNPRASYALYDKTEQKVEIRRIEYDIEAAAKRIRDAGLPVALGERLKVGR